MSDFASFEELRSLVYTGISGTYAAIGDPFDHPIKLICLTNNTNGDMIFSDDGVTNKLFIPAGSFKLFDLTTNRHPRDENYALRRNTQLYVKQSTVPTSGSVYVECLF